MSYPFVQHTGIKSAATPWKLTIPDVHSHREAGWKNLGLELYPEIFSAEELEKYGAEQFLYPMPPENWRSRLALRAKTFEYSVLFGLKGVGTGFRGTHFPGVGARGEIEVVASPELPENDFFVGGRKFPCRLRHANASFVDDRNPVVRGCALKFADDEFKSPLDVVLNSGATSAFWTLGSFAAFVTGRLKITPTDWSGQKEWMRKLPAAFVGTIESVRCGMDSYADIQYFSKIVFPFRARDGQRRYIKYRLLDPERTVEAGLISEEIQRKVWDQRMPKGDDRAPDYLRKEFAERVNKSGVDYMLQMQVWDWDDDRDTHEVLNLCNYWDEDTHPWIDVAHVRLREALAPMVTEKIRMWLGHQPPTLGVADSYHIRDFRSLAYTRLYVYPWSQHGRWLYRKILGTPKGFPKSDRIEPT